MVWLPGNEKNIEHMFTHFDTIHKRDRQTPRQTDGRTDTARRHRLRVCIASRGKHWYTAQYRILFTAVK